MPFKKFRYITYDLENIPSEKVRNNKIGVMTMIA